jgi:hypothetical protein
MLTGAIAAFAPRPAVPQPQGKAGPNFGGAVPPANETCWAAAQVIVIGPSVEEPALLFLNRASYNRLRNEAGFGPDDDELGLSLIVIAGEGAKQWGITPGDQVELVQLQNVVHVPESIIAGDDWFTTGVTGWSGGNIK